MKEQRAMRHKLELEAINWNWKEVSMRQNLESEVWQVERLGQHWWLEHWWVAEQ